MKSKRVSRIMYLGYRHSGETTGPSSSATDATAHSAAAADSGTLVPQLVAKVYETAPAHVRRKMLEQLMKPLGVLSLVAVANGVFAKIRFRDAWPDIGVRFEDTQNIQASDVFALVNHVQQVSTHAVDGLSRLVSASPILAGSAAAALLLKVLLQRSQLPSQRDDDLDP